MRKRLAKKLFNRQVKRMVYKPGSVLVVDSSETAHALMEAHFPPEWKRSPIIVGRVNQVEISPLIRWAKQQDPKRW